MAGYPKEFLIDAFMSRYFECISTEREVNLRKIAEAHYDKVGRDEFRKSASLDAEAIRKFREEFNV